VVPRTFSLSPKQQNSQTEGHNQYFHFFGLFFRFKKIDIKILSINEYKVNTKKMV